MQADERRVTLIALLGGLLLALFICFANFFVLYTLKLLSGGVPAGRYTLISLGMLLTGSPLYWLFKVNRKRLVTSSEMMPGKPPSYAPSYTSTYTERDYALVLEFTKQSKTPTLDDVMELTGLNQHQAGALLTDLEKEAFFAKSPAEKEALPPLKNEQNEDPFDLDFSE